GRREFLHGLTAAGTATVFGAHPVIVAAEPPPETKRLRLPNRPSLCEAPVYVADELLRGEGFTDITYAKKEEGQALDAIGTGDVDIAAVFGPPMIIRLDAGEPVVFLSGVHVGCAELFVNERIRTVRDLKGRRVAIENPRDSGHALTAIIAAHVGLKPETDIPWAPHPSADFPTLFPDG